MSYLQVQSDECLVFSKTHPEFQHFLTLQCSKEFLDKLILELAELKQELCLWIKDELVIYIKKTPQKESKGLMAHPEKNQWVGTLILSHEDYTGWLARVKGLGPGLSLSLHESFSLKGRSNLSIEIMHRV
jgi:hypothetical protein